MTQPIVVPNRVRAFFGYINANQVVPANSVELIIKNWITAFDTIGIINDPTNGLLIIPNNVSWIIVTVQAAMDLPGASSNWTVQLQKNESDTYQGRPTHTRGMVSGFIDPICNFSSAPLQVTKDDSFRVRVTQSHIASVNLFGDANANLTWISILSLNL